MQRFKLNLRGNTEDRLDGYRLYSLVLSHEEIARRLACLPDWERICLLDWAPAVKDIKNGKRSRRPRPPRTKAWNLSPSSATLGSR